MFVVSFSVKDTHKYNGKYPLLSWTSQNHVLHGKWLTRLSPCNNLQSSKGLFI